MKTKLIIISIFFFLNSTFGQTKEDLKFVAYNTLSSGIIGGVGSIIHKKNNETIFHAFSNGFKNGSLGGLINYSSKYMLTIQNPHLDLNWKIYWGSKILNSLSNTIIYNATMNETKIWKHYSIEIGFINLSTDYIAQISPISLFSTVFIASQKENKFDFKTSIKSAIPVFTMPVKWKYIDFKDGRAAEIPDLYGYCIAQNIIICKNINYISSSSITHEIIHSYQRNQYISINKLFNIYNKHSNYKFIHNDLSMFDFIYLTQQLIVGYNNNSFEKEAYYFEN